MASRVYDTSPKVSSATINMVANTGLLMLTSLKNMRVEARGLRLEGSAESPVDSH
jgi:hypothetical protein